MALQEQIIALKATPFMQRMQDPDDRAEIDVVMASFFAAFDNRAGRVPVQDELLTLFAEKSVIAKHLGG